MDGFNAVWASPRRCPGGPNWPPRWTGCSGCTATGRLPPPDRRCPARRPPVAAVRCGVRRSLADLAPGAQVLVACSGGADSLGPGRGDRLRGASGRRRGRAGHRRPRPAARAPPTGRRRSPTGAAGGDSARSWSRPSASSGQGGPEAAVAGPRVRRARRGGGRARCRRGAARPHPRRPGGDRAARPGPRVGARSLAGMAERRGIYRRPLLACPGARAGRRGRDAGLDAVGGPAQQRPGVRPGPGAHPARRRWRTALGPRTAPATWPVPRDCCGPTPMPWTGWPATSGPGSPAPTGAWTSPGSPRCPRRCGAG